jgi:phosphatidylserine/phosphatidylglycerophosphate/cardiolipin synthase-like enzyme
MQIINALNTAEYQIDLGLLLFTYRDLANMLKNKMQQHVKVRAIIEDTGTSSSIIADLRNSGAIIQAHTTSPIYHHKMAIIDGEYDQSNPILVSGSHNWTFTAETSNDENTMIFYDAPLTQLFKRAFSAQWAQLTTNVEELINQTMQYSLITDANSMTLPVEITKSTSLLGYNIMGQTVFDQIIPSGTEHVPLPNLSKGVYLFKVNDTLIKLVKI